MTATKVLKWNVPVDDKPHRIGAGRIAHIDCQGPADVVQVWTIERDVTLSREVQIYATGQPVPDGWGHLGTAKAAKGALIWHCFEKTPF